MRPSRLVLALIVGLAARPAAAQVFWTGINGPTWTDPDNFSSTPNNPFVPLLAVPGTGDFVYFGTAANNPNPLTTNLDQNFSILGLGVTTAPRLVTVNPNGAFTLTLGAGGIDMAAATQDLVVNAPVVMGAAQSWRVAAGRTFTPTAGISSTVPVALTLNNNAGVGTTGTVVLGTAANSFAAGSSLTLRNGFLPITNVGQLTGLTGGVSLNPLDDSFVNTDRPVLSLNTSGTTAAGIGLTLASTSGTLRPVVSVIGANNPIWSGAVTLSGAGGIYEMFAPAGASLTLNGGVGGSGTGTLLLNNNAGVGTSGTINLSASGTFVAGATVSLSNGTLRLSNPNALAGLTTNGVRLEPVSTGGAESPVLALNYAGSSPSGVPLRLAATPTLRTTLTNVPGTNPSWDGQIRLDGSGINQWTVAGANTLTLNGAVTDAGSFTGSVVAGGTGNGLIGGTVTLPNGAFVKTNNSSLWTIASSGNSWATTTVAAGTLRSFGATLPPTAPLTLGQPNGSVAERFGILDLNGTNQTVGGLTTNTSLTESNPNGNLIGQGLNAGPGLQATLTVNRTGSAQAFDGVLQNNLSGATTNTLSFTLSAGDLTLRSTNTFTGPTVVSGTSTLRLATLTNAAPAFTNHGSVANSPTVTLTASGASLAITGTFGTLTGGPNLIGATFAPAVNQTVQGIGTVSAATTVRPTATARGGVPGGADATGALSVAGNLVFQGGTPGVGVGQPNGQYAVDLGGTSVSLATVGRVQATAGGTVDFDTTGGPVRIALLNDLSLNDGTSYSYVIGSAAGGYRINGNPVGVGGYTFPTDFTLTTGRPNHLFFDAVTLIPDGSNNLVLTFTPVPEPATVLGLAVAGLVVARRVRRWVG